MRNNILIMISAVAIHASDYVMVSETRPQTKRIYAVHVFRSGSPFEIGVGVSDVLEQPELNSRPSPAYFLGASLNTNE